MSIPFPIRVPEARDSGMFPDTLKIEASFMPEPKKVRMSVRPSICHRFRSGLNF